MNLKHLNPYGDFGSAMPSRAIHANALTANSPKFWSRRMQVIHNKKDNFRQTANFEERARLTKGRQVTRPKKSALFPQDYTKGVAFTVKDVTATEELLTIDQAKVTPFYVDDIDEIQNIFRAATEWADEGGEKLSNEVDADYQAEYANANSTLDDADITGGTAGEGITPTVSNILKIFAAAGRKLDDKNISDDKRFANVSPFVHQIILEHLAGKDSALGDKSSLGGHQGKFMGFNIFKTTNLTATAVLSMATQPTDGDTVVIQGVTFTYKTTLGSTAGNVLIGASADAARVNLEGLINAPGTTDTEGVALDDTNPTDQTPSDREIMRRITATDSPSGDTLTIVAKGKGNLVLSETFTDGTDTWTPATELQHLVLGQMGAIDVVVQKEINVKFKDVPDKIGKNIVPWELYGIKTFNEGAEKLLDVLIRTDALTSFPSSGA